MRNFTSLLELDNKTDFLLGVSEWLTIDQACINQFADATGDHQWIHLDATRAQASEFGGTIAHGYLLLSLIPRLSASAYRIDGVNKKVNYGLDRCRFIHPVLCDSEVRAHFTLTSVSRNERFHKLQIQVRMEIRHQHKPAFIADTLVVMFS